MANLTRKDFVWLATEIAPLLAPGTLDEFVSSVQEHASNHRFKKAKFKDVAWESWNARNADRFMTDALGLDDNIPYLEDDRGTDTAAA